MSSKAYSCLNEYWNELEDNEDYSQLTFFHGTSDMFDIAFILPAEESGCLREGWRKRLTDKVFFTDNLYSAQKYAQKACMKFGGNPIVYVVRPAESMWKIQKDEYVADWAEVISVTTNN